ncbi:MAG: hypothetical protein AAGI88_22155 [Pseudomonadota bacterium]
MTQIPSKRDSLRVAGATLLMAPLMVPLTATAHPGHLSDPGAHFFYHAAVIGVSVAAAAFIASRIVAWRNKQSRQPAPIRTSTRTNTHSSETAATNSNSQDN